MSTTKISSLDTKIEQLQNQRKQLIQKEKQAERKARNHRLFTHGGMLEQLRPELAELPKEQVQIFLKKTIGGNFAVKILTEMRGGEG